MPIEYLENLKMKQVRLLPFIMPADILVHSFGKAKITMPPFEKVQKLLNIVLWFVKKLEYIINNASSNFDEFDNEVETVVREFWQHVQ